MGGFDVVDRNSDGVIDREEFDAMLLANTATTMATEAAAASHLGATMTSDAAASLLGTSALHDPEEDVTRAPVLRATGGEMRRYRGGVGRGAAHTWNAGRSRRRARIKFELHVPK